MYNLDTQAFTIMLGLVVVSHRPNQTGSLRIFYPKKYDLQSWVEKIGYKIFLVLQKFLSLLVLAMEYQG